MDLGFTLEFGLVYISIINMLLLKLVFVNIFFYLYHNIESLTLGKWKTSVIT